MAKVKFPSEMPSANNIGGNDKMMIAKEGTGETYQATFDQAKQYLTIEGQRIPSVPAGVLPAGPAGQTRYMEVTAVGTWTYGGSPVGSNAEGFKTTFWWTGSTVVDNESVKVKGDPGANGSLLAIEYTVSSADAGLTHTTVRTYQGAMYRVKAGQTTLATDIPRSSSKYETVGASIDVNNVLSEQLNNKKEVSET